MEFRKLTASDLASLLDLYRQLDEDDESCTIEQSERVWKEIEENTNIQYFGALDNGKVVSSCYAVDIPNLTRGNRMSIMMPNGSQMTRTVELQSLTGMLSWNRCTAEEISLKSSKG